METLKIKRHLEKAIESLFCKQPNIFGFTSQTHQTEWNLACHLAKEIHLIFPEYDYDLDVVKPNLGNKRPDIVLHKRGTNNYNFLVVEVKKAGQPAEIDADEGKIMSCWFGKELHYRYGAIINIKQDCSYEIKIIKNSAPIYPG